MEFGFVQLVVLAFDEYGLAEGIRDGLIQRYSELAPRIVADPQTLAAATDLHNVVHINANFTTHSGTYTCDFWLERHDEDSPYLCTQIEIGFF